MIWAASPQRPFVDCLPASRAPVYVRGLRQCGVSLFVAAGSGWHQLLLASPRQAAAGVPSVGSVR
jgi:hypothetical protein